MIINEAENGIILKDAKCLDIELSAFCGQAFRWKKNEKGSGYQIRYGTSKDFEDAKTIKSTSRKTSSKTLSSLKKKTTYYVQVRSYKTVNGKVYYSSWSAVKRKKTPSSL